MNPILKRRLSRKNASLWRWIWHKIGFVAQIIAWAVVFFFLMGILWTLYTKIFPQGMGISLNDYVLIVTAAILFVYTYETQQTKKELASQSEIEQMPVMVLLVRETMDLIENEGDRRKFLRKGYGIERRTDNGLVQYAFTLKNVGKGPAFNVRIWSEKLGADKQEERFFAPMDECLVSIRKLGDERGSFKMIEDFQELENEVISVCCESLSGREYFFNYRVTSVDKKKVEFVDREKL